jgi:hypothetical protein
MDSEPDSEGYVKIAIQVDKSILKDFDEKLDMIGLTRSWFLGICMHDYIKKHFRIIDGEVEDTRRLR